ncbi:MAG: hypothetical protein EVJ47_03230 [Candidatus Acidulodesulfobacterium ferriphilum]|uniref:PilC beta-propeller domain-containing protein n=1 Tax=Candidatus Acidulodesulfobacterium ferriphilum TaxID=2597223 RepID=A0A519BDG9_9DELT|nr:MAG: hypothetical protein EVJ47_03230 [Candidatus Acidulodesulfobacterium ferriphilum]
MLKRVFSALIIVFGVYIALFAFAGSAAAASGVNDVDIPPNISQSAPPNVLIFLDTSGSMMWNEQVNWSNPTATPPTSGTDAPETWLKATFFSAVQAPGSNSVFSKIYNAKMALQDIVTNPSFNNLNYAFATFQPLLLSTDADNCIYAKNADGGLDFTNPASALHYPGSPGGSGTPIQSGAYPPPTGTNYPFESLACTGNGNLTAADFVSYDYGPYIINQDLGTTTSPWELWVPQITGANTVPAGDQFFEPADTAGAAIENILWNDKDYKNGGFGDLKDPADSDVIGLKAGGGTPMWSMVTNMTQYYTNYISSLSTASTGATCARNYSIIITDGEANGYKHTDTPVAVYDLYYPATTGAPNPIETFIIGFGYTAGIGGKSYLQGMADGGVGIDPSNSPAGLAISGAVAGSSPTTLNLSGATVSGTAASGTPPPGGAYITNSAGVLGVVLVGDTISDISGEESDTCETSATNNFATGDCATVTGVDTNNGTITLSNALNSITSLTVSGTIYLPNNLAALTSSLTAIFNQIESQTASFTSPVVNQTSSTSGFVYYANFKAFSLSQPLWGEGNIFLFHLNASGQLSGPGGSALTSSGTINVCDSYWDEPPSSGPACAPGNNLGGAGGLLQAESPSSRNILTSNYNPSTGAVVPDTATGGTSEIPFNTADDSTLAPLLGITSTNYLTVCPSAASVDACADDVINFVLNPNPSDNWKLGAIYHSDPVLVTPPPFAYPSASYQQFKINNASRQNVLVAGANDGMVHGFNAADSWDTTTNSYTCLTGTCGAEMFGYIPPDLLPELTSWYNPAFNPTSATTPDKEYEFVDSTPALSDVYFNNIFSVSGAPAANTVNANSSANAPDCVGTTGADCWHTIAISGERNGGQSYFALGLTNPANVGKTTTPYPDPLWDFSDAANSPAPAATAPMGNTWSQPVISYVCMLNPFYSSSDTGGTGICGNNPQPAASSDTPQFVKTYVGVVGGGYLPDNPAGTVVAGQAVYVLYAEPNPVNTGTATAPVYTDEQELWKFDSSSTGGTDMNYQIPSAVAPVLSTNFRLEAFYVGDLGGQMWAFDTPGGQDITAPVPKTDSDILSNWTGCPLFQSTTTSTATPLNIFFPPAVAYDSLNNLWLFFGTGNMENLNGQNTRDNELIAINTAGIPTGECPTSPYSETNLGNVTTGSTVTATADGWYIKLQPNERLVAPAVVYDNIAYFVTYTPLSPGACGYGTASLYAVNYLTGAGEVTTNTGASSGTVTSIGTGGTSQSGEIGTGVPSAPVISSTISGGKATLTITTQSGQLVQLPIPAQSSAVMPTSWFQLP